LALHPEKVCDKCKGETPGGKVVDAFQLLSTSEKEAVLEHIGLRGKGCDGA
jgi:hypothetical protein